MATSDIGKVSAMILGIGSGDFDLAVRYIHPGGFTEHNPLSADGVEGLKKYVAQISEHDHHLKLVRAFQDGDFVFSQAEGFVLGQSVFFDVFRLEDGMIVEHWSFSTKTAPPNRSGHTQTDGPTEGTGLEATENSKALVRKYYETIHVSGDHSRIPEYFSGDFCIRHEPGVRDGVANFKSDLEELVKHRTIDEIRFLFGQDDFVFIAAKGTVKGEPCVYLDLYRVEHGKIVERWGFPDEGPPRAQWTNENVML